MSNLFFDEKTNPDDFRAIKLIGSGGYGQVIEIQHIPTGKYLAGKLLKTDEFTSDVVDEIKKEVSIMKGINSKYTVNYYGTIKYPRLNPRLMIIMDYCDRGSLRDIMDFNEQTLNEQQISFIMYDILKALDELHTKFRTIHRDIKAANILMSSDFSIKLTDFGVSRQFNKAKSMYTITVIGTPYWMAPEIINQEQYSFPVDIWSIGATAIELAEGAPPYYELPPTRAMTEIANHGLIGFRMSSEFTEEFQDFVRTCTVMDPALRPDAATLLKHPFITQAEKLDRRAAFQYLLKKEIDFNELLEDDDIDQMKSILDFQTQPVFNPETNKSQNRKTLKSFVTPSQPGANLNTLYVEKAKVATPKPANTSSPFSIQTIIIAIFVLILAIKFIF